MPENSGMLFIFDRADYHSFWMKEMKFAIDIIWMGEDKRIIDITHNAKPESYPSSFKPSLPAKYVLEVNYGWADAQNIKIGERLDFFLR